MKHSFALNFCAFASVLTLLAYCRPMAPEPDQVIQRQDSLTIAQVRELGAHLIPDQIYIKDAGKEGLFMLDLQDEQSADNTGIVLVTAKGHRYKRVFSGAANVTWFGVSVLDTDIGPALQTAITATDELFIPDGLYTQRTAVYLRSNLLILANQGKATILLPESYVSLVNSPDPSVDLRNVLIDGLAWRVTSAGKGTYGPIYIDGPSVSDLTIQNCSSTDVAAKDSTNWLTVKIQAGKTADRVIVRNNTVQAKRMGCEIFNHDNYNVYAGKDVQVTGNVFYDCHFGCSLSGPLENIVVSDNDVKNCSLFGIEIAGAARNVRITNNRFEGVFDKFLEGSNDGNGNGSIVGGMVITGNSTVGLCRGGMQLFNGGAVIFSKNTFIMSGMLELAHSTAGGTFTENVIESLANKAIICDNSPNNTFTNNTISNRNSTENQATLMAYGSKATNNVATNNKLIQGAGGKPYDAVLGGSLKASMNYDGEGNLLP